MQTKNQKELQALYVGFVLILFVVAISVYRYKSPTPGNNTDDNALTQQKLTNHAYPVVAARDLQGSLALSGNFVLLDIRPFEDYARQHIMDAVNIPVSEFPAESKIDTSKKVILIGNSGDDSDLDKAYAALKKENISNVVVLAGGMEAWNGNNGSTISFGDPTSFADQSKVSYVQPDDLHQALTDNATMFILDVRNPDEFSAGHIKGAYNIPFNDLEKRRNEISGFSKIVVTGSNELQEFQASVKLFDMFMSHAFVMKGGLDAWKQKNYELVK